MSSVDPSQRSAPADPGPAGAAAAGDGPAPARRGRLARDLRRGLASGLRTFWELAVVMVPAYGATLVLERLGVVAWLARLTAPLMRALGLPGEAAVPLVVGWVLNIYAAVGSLQALDLDRRQVTVLALAVLIGHNLLVEGAVLQRAGMNGVAFSLLRALAGLAAAAVANVLIGIAGGL